MFPHTSPSGLLRRPVLLSSRLRYVPFPVNVWCPMLRSKALKAGQCHGTRLLGTRLAVFRGADGHVCALEDRCPHRGVPLSLGAVRAHGIQCAYHGWLIGGDGRVRSVPSIGPLEDAPTVRTFAARERAGLVWVFLGAAELADRVPLPELAPYGTPESVDLPLALENETHWSLLFDNGMDLFHGHLHRGVPYFFEIHSLEKYAIEADGFSLRYRATLAAAFNTRRKGNIDIKVSTSAATASLDFGGLPLVRVFATPHSADGTQLTAWYLLSFSLPAHQRAVLRLTLPFVRRSLVRGFAQDAHILRAELLAMREGVLEQNEVNPLLVEVHARSQARLATLARDTVRCHGRLRCWPRDDLVRGARNGTLAVVAEGDEGASFLSPTELEGALQPAAMVSLPSYYHVCLLDTRTAQTQAK